MKLLNLGCGTKYHKNWINIDFVSTGEGVIAHNLTKGIPFEDECFDVVYHSHVLEHFSKKDGAVFIKECYRVLKPKGIIRIAVPDLENIIKHYLEQLNKALAGDEKAKYNYDWMMLELYDQTVRNYSGGAMAEYLYQENLPNEDFIYNRVGNEARNIRENYLDFNYKVNPEKKSDKEEKSGSAKKKISFRSYLANKIKSALFSKELERIRNKEKKYNQITEYQRIGAFRLGGEVHQWMYDRYSLATLLKDTGFSEPEVKTAFKSSIPQWESYELESKDGLVFKPDSLFMEAVKK
jgi:predicted SAM-dependent methyltransferase